MAGTVIVMSCDKLINKGRAIAGRILEAAITDIEFSNGIFRVQGTDRCLSLYELARQTQVIDLPREYSGGLNLVCSNEMHTPVIPNGCDICEVELDPDTCSIELVRYTAVDDVGRAINPMIVRGQSHGAIVQGLGQAMVEACVIDKKSGQTLTGSFMDYGMLRADNVPMFDVGLNEVPSPTNLLGVKAGGEGGTTSSPVVFINAVVDALSFYGIKDIKMPATPYAVWQAIHERGNS